MLKNAKKIIIKLLDPLMNHFDSISRGLILIVRMILLLLGWINFYLSVILVLMLSLNRKNSLFHSKNVFLSPLIHPFP